MGRHCRGSANLSCKPRPWASEIVAIAHNANLFDLHFILNRAILLKWKPEHELPKNHKYLNGAPSIGRRVLPPVCIA